MSPVEIVAAPCAAAATTTRSGPEPSSIVTPRPSARVDGLSVTTPLTASRRPSRDSAAAPVVTPIGSGRSAVPVGTMPAAVVLTVRRLK